MRRLPSEEAVQRGADRRALHLLRHSPRVRRPLPVCESDQVVGRGRLPGGVQEHQTPDEGDAPNPARCPEVDREREVHGGGLPLPGVQQQH